MMSKEWVDKVTATKQDWQGTRAGSLEKLGSKKEGGSQQIEYKLAKLAFKG